MYTKVLKSSKNIFSNAAKNIHVKIKKYFSNAAKKYLYKNLKKIFENRKNFSKNSCNLKKIMLY